MKELAPGVFHWKAVHPNLGAEVSSYFLAGTRTAIDPLLPPEGIGWFDAADGDRRPQRIVLTNRHHLRDSEELASAYGIPILCHEAGLHEFKGGPDVKGFAWDDELAPGVKALEVGAICDEETALRIDVGDGLLAVADGVIREGGRLGFVPEEHLGNPGEDPEDVKGAIRAAYDRLLDEPFDGLLPAHGDPVVSGGKDELRRFVQDGA
jgi:hypothetical protein